MKCTFCGVELLHDNVDGFGNPCCLMCKQEQDELAGENCKQD